MFSALSSQFPTSNKPASCLRPKISDVYQQRSLFGGKWSPQQDEWIIPFPSPGEQSLLPWNIPSISLSVIHVLPAWTLFEYEWTSGWSILNIYYIPSIKLSVLKCDAKMPKKEKVQKKGTVYTRIILVKKEQDKYMKEWNI